MGHEVSTLCQVLIQSVPMKTPFSRAVGNRLKFARDEAGLRTAGQLAEKMELSELTVRRHLRGDTMPDVETLLHYAAVLDVSLDDLAPKWAPSDSNRQPTDHRFDRERELVAS
jgi:transcriptional regulator with XRE-family HTH domain